ncbi:hypothetical protein Dvina_46840 [Dactylosporangium vinaceum]|uniref:DUF5655 domain-containing protein n=1 Tax=Dactylosporangium vinaceum TaxID=53362 RepID=A0ABV5M187_9ACTN|nr:DUF5655 domain-containing protein [Dactylosporangium vinaceum]UAB95459.1 hypothetical protein Dvina_46840 [Dactylosporangium vinaceum]
MARWICPECEREFDRARQGHVCVPGGTVDETFAGRPGYQRAAYDAIIGLLEALGPVHEDAVKVGVFLKRERKLAEIRPMARALSVELYLPRPVDDERVARHYEVGRGRFVNVVRLTGAGQVDERLRGWLTEAFEDAGP